MERADTLKAVSENVPDPGITRCVDLLSAAHDVLLIGDVGEELLHALDRRGCSIACILTGSMDEDEARIFATQVTTVMPADISIPPEFLAGRADAIVLCDPSDRLSDLAGVLQSARHILGEDGIVVAAVGSPRFDIFTRAGYVIEGADELHSVIGSLLVHARPAATLSSPSAVGAESVQGLYLELEREQAARHQLLHALATAERSAAEIQRKASDIAARRNDYETQSLALVAEREARLRLHIALLLSQHVTDVAQRDAANAEADWYSLLTQLESTRADADKAFSQMRAMLENARRDRDVAKARVDRLTTIETSSKERAAELQRKISDLEREVSGGAAYVKQLLGELDAIRIASLADKAVMQAYADDVRERSERSLNGLRCEIAAATERERQTSEGLTQRIEDLQAALREAESRLGAETRELRERVASAEGALAAQTDAVIATLQAESAQLSQLVDTVQSSRFWRFKRWLNRLRGSFRS
ncbi:MAG TPA: hypothetical protein VGG89_11375 [Candidatus Baltobacteraceae bacterium]|jgi:hypothetical protein